MVPVIARATTLPLGLRRQRRRILIACREPIPEGLENNSQFVFFAAHSVEEALSILNPESLGIKPSAAFIDMSLPSETGENPSPGGAMKLIRDLQTLCPRTRVFPVFGEKGTQVPSEDLFRIGISGWLSGPLSREKIAAKLDSVSPPTQWAKWFDFKGSISKREGIFLGVLSFLLFFFTWCVLSYGHLVKPIFLPTPTKVLSELYVLLATKNFIGDIFASISRVLTGFLLAAAIAIPLGILMGSFKFVAALVNPFTAFVRYMPATAFVPLLILWLGLGFQQKVAVIFLGIFFYLLVLVTTATIEVPKDLIETAFTLGASKIHVLFRVMAPAALPGILEGLRTMIGAAWTYLIVAELVSADAGIGKVIIQAQRNLLTGRVIAGILVIGLIGVITDILFRKLYARLLPWKG